MQGWKISCFRNDNPSSESPLPDFSELVSEERVKPDLDKAVVNKKDWTSVFIKVIVVFLNFQPIFLLILVKNAIIIQFWHL